LPVPFRITAASSRYKNERDDVTPLRLQEAILVGNIPQQVKFSELTLDMYRVLQSLEREPLAAKALHSEGIGNEDSSSTRQRDSSVDDKSRRVNPHKYLLFKPSISQLLAYTASAFKVRPNVAVGGFDSCAARIWQMMVLYTCTFLPTTPQQSQNRVQFMRVSSVCSWTRRGHGRI
jgi:hypothetical protein